MPFFLKVFDEVLTDTQEAKEWYFDKRAVLEIEFANEIENCITRILLNPEIHSVRYKNVRIAHPKRFPYNIHFYIDAIEAIVIITAIVHNKRNPNFSKDRI
jgi:plasmid stabilization system protein ParE